MKQYEAILARSLELGWPEVYKTDLTTHDRNYLESAKPDRFVWGVRTHGTHLADMTEEGLRWVKAAEKCKWEPLRWFYYDGTLTEMTYQQILDTYSDIFDSAES